MDFRHRASSAGRDQLPAGPPPAPLQRPGTWRHHDPGQPRTRGYYRAPPRPHSLKCPELFVPNSFCCIILSMPPKPLREQPLTPKVTQKCHRKTPRTTKNTLQEGDREKYAKIHKTLSQQTLEICDLKMERIAKSLFPIFTHSPNESPKNTPKVKQKSLKYHHGDGFEK